MDKSDKKKSAKKTTLPTQTKAKSVEQLEHTQLKIELEIMKMEINKLQTAQINLEKSLKERPIIYASYNDKAG